MVPVLEKSLFSYESVHVTQITYRNLCYSILSYFNKVPNNCANSYYPEHSMLLHNLTTVRQLVFRGYYSTWKLIWFFSLTVIRICILKCTTGDNREIKHETLWLYYSHIFCHTIKNKTFSEDVFAEGKKGTEYWFWRMYSMYRTIYGKRVLRSCYGWKLKDFF